MTPEQIKRDTALFGLMGDALEKTPLPSLINAFYDFNGLNAFCSIFNIREEDIPFFLTNVKKRAIAGLFIQPSHMEAALTYIDASSGAAAASGAVDSGVISGGRLIGYNFKAEGIAGELFGAGIEAMTVAVMGTGALALAAGMEVAARRPAKMVVVDASPEEAMAFAKKITAATGYDAFEISRCAEGVVTDLSACDAVLNFLTIEEREAFSDLKPGAKVYDAEGSFNGASWQKEVVYQGPYYMTMLQVKGMSDVVLGGSSRIDEAYMESAEVIEIF